MIEYDLSSPTSARTLSMKILPRKDLDTGLWVIEGLRKILPIGAREAVMPAAHTDLQRLFKTYVIGFTQSTRMTGDLADAVLDLESIVKDHAAWPVEWADYQRKWLSGWKIQVLVQSEDSLAELRSRFTGLDISRFPAPLPVT